MELLVALAGLHLEVELVLIGAELEQILTGLIAVRLKQVLNTIRGVLEANLLFLRSDEKNTFIEIEDQLD